MKLFQKLFRHIGIDLGSTRVRIWDPDLGVVIDEPTAIAVDNQTGKVVAVGHDAAQMKGRLAGQVTVHHPVQAGLIDDPQILQGFLQVLLQKVITSPYFFRPVVMVSLPSYADPVAKQAMIEVLYQVGAREVYTIAQPLAAAIGAGVPIADASGSFVLHAGGGVVEGGIISLGSLVASQTELHAGLVADELIQQAVAAEYQLRVSQEVADRIKREIGGIGLSEGQYLASGQDVGSGAPREVMVQAEVISLALQPLADRYLQLMQRLLEKVPPELTVDVIDKGMLMSGGLAQLAGLDQFLVEELGVSAAVVEDTDRVVITGIGTALQHLDLFKESLGYLR